MQEAVTTLITGIIAANKLEIDDIVSVIFTATPDLVSDFPAASARAMGLAKTPLLCAVELAVPGSMPRVIRTLIHCYTPLKLEELSHIYLGDTAQLRKDLAQ